jgi:uncharacterized membrane-anchored protein
MNRAMALFGAAVLLQLVILAAVPYSKMHTRKTGVTVILKTAPIDPYSVMSGYYVTLTYEISRLSDAMRSRLIENKDCYVVLEQDPNDPYGFWNAVSVSMSFPATLAPGQVVIKGRYEGWTVTYGIERYYIPEDKRQTLEQAIRKNRDATRIEVKVDAKGNAALSRLLIGNEVYDY